MKTLYALFVLLFAFSVIGAEPGYKRNVISTNDPTVVTFGGIAQVNDTILGWDTVDNQFVDMFFGANLTYTHATHTISAAAGAAQVYSNQTVTIAGTANQITSSVGAQDLSVNRTWTLSIPNDFRVPSQLTVTSGQTNLHLTASQFVATDPNKALASTLNARPLTNYVGTNLIAGFPSILLGRGTGALTDEPVKMLQVGPGLAFTTDRLVIDNTAITGSLAQATMPGTNLTGTYIGAGLTMNTARVLGRTTAGVGAAEELSAGTGISIAAGQISTTSLFTSPTNNAVFTNGFFDASFMVVSWGFDEATGTTSVDRTGNGHNISMTNSPTWTNGTKNSAISLDGSNDLMGFPAVTLPSTWTLDFWVNPADVGADTATMIYDSVLDRGIFYRKGSNKLDYNDGSQHDNTTALTDFYWQRITITKDAGGAVVFYLNGNPDGSFAGLANFNPNIIGGTPGGAALFGGSLDELNWYNYTMTPIQVSTLTGIAGVPRTWLSAPNFAINTLYTNGFAFAHVGMVAELNLGAATDSGVSLFIDQNNDGAYEIEIPARFPFIGVGVAGIKMQLTGWLQPQARFCFSNTVGSAGMINGSGQYKLIESIR